jgi:hypothetical protein
MQKEKDRGFFCPLFLQDVKVNKEGSKVHGSAVHGSTVQRLQKQKGFGVQQPLLS